MLFNTLISGLQALGEYLSAHVLSCLIPAFFIAGAISVFISQSAIIKYFGPKASKIPAYTVASVSGAVLAVCSCTILPLFAGIRQRGAGLGPAITFLYSGPAINILAIMYSAQLLGIDLGIARAIAAIIFSILTGFIMSLIFKSEIEGNSTGSNWKDSQEEDKFTLARIVPFFLVMVAFLIAASSMGLIAGISQSDTEKWSLVFTAKPLPAIIATILFAIIILMTVKLFSGDEFIDWMQETWNLISKIFPILLLGVFIVGIIRSLLPESVIQTWLGGNSLGNNLLASVFGALMYFSTLTEVPIVKALMDLGMGKGPALSLLLAGPSLSLPNIIVINKVIGLKKTSVYVLLVIVLSTSAGLIMGSFA